MNKKLSKEIIKHIFYIFGILKNKNIIGFQENFMSSKFIIDKKIMFDFDGDSNGDIKQNQIWSSCAKIENYNIYIIIGDLSYEDVKEYVLLFKFDEYNSYALRLSDDIDDFGSIYFNHSNNWIEANTFIQAKLLQGIEQLLLLHFNWEKNNSYEKNYEELIGFISFNERMMT